MHCAAIDWTVIRMGSVDPRETIPPSADASVSAGPVNILFIEDSEHDVELAVRTLERDGLQASWRQVATEPTLKEALAAALPDVIVSDFSMPGFDGLLALRISRQLAPAVPFIFVSGTIGEER